ncbi:quinohemoprotein alcohol dehydrogenase protein [Herbaspirillum rubrisubalbicans M1]|uniref:transporter n=1 Tax=Herbaspirillum rubrisubalbicans TaxID=80842 RepID=UPI00073ABBFA|nr:transporter [Herbaspirillum rubrisubalbicans]ALU88016.1 quinohemoprotein alcohol dehydrogenase protein [Herbaspirillum rubrisubalbicans M1]
MKVILSRKRSRALRLRKAEIKSPSTPVKRIPLLASVLSVTMLPIAAQAIDVDIGDFVPAPAGTTVGLLYYQHVERTSLYAQGQKAATDPKLDSDIGIARLVHYTTIGGLAFAPQVMVPFGREDAGRDTAALGQTSGVGDIILAAPFWPVNDAASRTYLGIAPYLYLPTGSYDHNRALNLGENRWKFDLQVGFVKGLTDKWYLELTGDGMVYGKNGDYGSSGATQRQKPLFQGQSYLRYQFTPAANVFVSLSQTWGGETRINGVDSNDEARERKASIGGSWFILPKTQLLMALGRDLSVENGFKENARINLRLLHVF